MTGSISPWRPISTAPKDGTLIDVWANGERETSIKWGEFKVYPNDVELYECDYSTWLYFSDDYGEWRPLMRKGHDDAVTYWMPLPEPPQ